VQRVWFWHHPRTGHRKLVNQRFLNQGEISLRALFIHSGAPPGGGSIFGSHFTPFGSLFLFKS
jgi:hypothetical protein